MEAACAATEAEATRHPVETTAEKRKERDEAENRASAVDQQTEFDEGASSSTTEAAQPKPAQPGQTPSIKH